MSDKMRKKDGETITHPMYGPWDVYEGVPPATFVVVPKGTPHPIPGVPEGAEPVKPPAGTLPPETQPPYPSTGPGFPTNPIQLPPWAGKPQPPWAPVDPDYDPWRPKPTHPIMLPGMPGWGLVPIAPGGPRPEHPIYWPPAPTHPIVLPPPASGGAPVHPSHPIYWPGAHPEHPIWPPPGSVVIPPSEPGVPTHPIVIPPAVDPRPVYLVYVVNLPAPVESPGGGTPAPAPTA
jgi:hypothetical protein